MDTHFEVAAGSVIGREHRRIGRNNQDAYAIQIKPAGTIAGVCDGCGSCRHSEVGAQLGVRWVIAAIDRQWQREPSRLSDLGFWQGLQPELLGHIQHLAMGLGADLAAIVRDYFLFTIVGAIITPETTVIFSLGDGIAMVNDEVLLQGTIADNRPPYLAYSLFASEFSIADIQFTTHLRSTAMVNTIMIGI